MLGDLMGREHNFAGLQRFIADHQNNPGHAVVHDFEVHMRRYAPDPAAYDQFAKQWLDSVVVPEYRLTAAKSVKTADGWETSVHVENVGTGREPAHCRQLRKAHQGVGWFREPRRRDECAATLNRVN